MVTQLDMWDKKFKQSDRKKFLHLIQYIVDAIDGGKLKSGQALPTQRELSKRLNLSIGTIISISCYYFEY